eukprot:COSAG01_NODE_62117_length_286_cov_0.818182_1_plen_42_part_10
MGDGGPRECRAEPKAAGYQCGGQLRLACYCAVCHWEVVWYDT